MNYELDDKHNEEYSRLNSVLSKIDDFFIKHPVLNYIEFDYYTVHDLTLFSVEPDFDFDTLSLVLQKISGTLPSVKRIFVKPIIHLKDNDDVLPVESVHIINQNTIQHIACHSENVSNITEEGITPLKLLTRVYEDNYSIYENVIVCNFVDDVLKYVRRNIRTLKDLVYTNEIMEFDLLERVNHVNYFLALGKLQTGYIRDFYKYCNVSKKVYDDLLDVTNTLQPRLVCRVYQKNKHRNKHLALKKTNIFLNQKDYHHVYVTYKYMINKNVIKGKPKEELDYALIARNYYRFVETLIIFAAGHFNFDMTNAEKIDLNKLNIVCTCKEWMLHIQDVDHKGFLIEIIKEKTYRYLLIPSIDYYGQVEDKSFLHISVDEILVCSPFEDKYSSRTNLFLSIENIESFRRVQQLLLKGMVESDTQRTECPFCLGELTQLEDGSYKCESCRTEIKEDMCSETQEKFFYTNISSFSPKEIHKNLYNKDDEWLFDRKVEASMFFRNITKINEKGEIVCPKCGKVHLSSK